MKSKTPCCVSVVVYFALQFSSPVRAEVTDAPDAKVANIPVNYTEAKVGAYVLPDPLKLASGEPVRDATTWTQKRRPELIDYYRKEIYGRIPETAPKAIWQVVSSDPRAGRPGNHEAIGRPHGQSARPGDRGDIVHAKCRGQARSGAGEHHVQFRRFARPRARTSLNEHCAG